MGSPNDRPFPLYVIVLGIYENKSQEKTSPAPQEQPFRALTFEDVRSLDEGIFLKVKKESLLTFSAAGRDTFIHLHQ